MNLNTSESTTVQDLAFQLFVTNSHRNINISDHKYRIRVDKNTIIEEEPQVDAWYCGFYIADDFHADIDEALAKYVGEGCFIDDDSPYSPEEVDMRDYDFLVKQS